MKPESVESIFDAKQRALANAAAKTRQECAEAFRQGFNDANCGRPKKGFSDKEANAAYQQGYAKGGKGLVVKL